MAHKQTQLTDKVRTIKGLAVCWVLLNLISLGVIVSLSLQSDDVLDDQSKIEGRSRHYEERPLLLKICSDFDLRLWPSRWINTNFCTQLERRKIVRIALMQLMWYP